MVRTTLSFWIVYGFATGLFTGPFTGPFTGLSTGLSTARADSGAELAARYQRQILPFLNTYCLNCHGAKRQEAKLNLAGYRTAADVSASHPVWAHVLERLEAGEMPPDDAPRRPKAAERKTIVRWIRALRRWDADRQAGDPGPVLTRRLSNAEYNNTIRDLTGVDIRPTRTFPVDPANEAGFDNSGESLAMSPALLKKYLGAAREVAEHIVFRPDSFAFAPHPVVTETDRDKYAVKRIVRFYLRQPTDLSAYFFAAWQVKRANKKPSPKDLAAVAQAQQVSPKYLQTIWKTLEQEPSDLQPFAGLQELWRALPVDASDTDAARAGCQKMKAYVLRLRKKLEPTFPNLYIQGNHRGSQPFVLWKNRQYAAYRRKYGPQVFPEKEPPRSATATADRELWLPVEPDKRRKQLAAWARFCAVFPDAFYVSERGRDYVGKPKEQQEKGRLLSAGFHSMMGYFRDDRPLYDLILSPAEQAEIDRLWRELDFSTGAPLRQYAGFLWFERTDSRYMRDPVFDFARPEDRSAASEEKVKRLAKVYLAKAKKSGGSEVALEAIAHYFHEINAQIRWVEKTRREAEPRHLKTLLDFAARAARRPLSKSEREDLLDFYRSLRKSGGLSHEQAIRDAVTSILMSPQFCYRLDLGGDGPGRRPLSDIELASRLSYFLWASMPDAELLKLAAAKQLRRPDILRTQVRRMLRDQKVRGLATEFAANWLDIRRFQQHNSVDRRRFPQFTDSLRSAMFEEPIRFFVDLVQRNGSLTELLDSDHTFVNRDLASHYGLDAKGLAPNQWRRVTGIRRVGRGGLPAMAVFLTHNSPGLRTSPVKRGYWIARRLLGERIPAPPPNVPDLPEDEAGLGDLTLRQVLTRHRAHAACAGCHRRFDSLGLVLENYGPIGERRQRDLGGRPVDAAARLPGGPTATGLHGLRDYLVTARKPEFVANFQRKLLSYALGRSLLLSDEALLARLQEQSRWNEERLEPLVQSIVLSPQFLQKRAAHGSSSSTSN